MTCRRVWSGCLYVGVAIVLVVATLVVRSFAVQDRVCDQARAVYDGGRTEQAWRDRADAAGYLLTVERKSTYTRYRLARDDRVVAGWLAGSISRGFECPPGS